MNGSFFFGKKSNFVQSHSKLYSNINKHINTIGNFNVSGKYYSFLNKRNLGDLRNSDFNVMLKSFGKNYILFLCSEQNKNYCVFINKKNLVMNVVQIKFSSDLFEGTLFDGEIVKTENNKYIFLINDLPYYKGRSLITETFEYRHSILENVLKNKYILDEQLYIVKKEYFNVNEINKLVNNYMTILNYKCSGLLFKNNTNFSNNYLFNFPECRSDSKILKNGVTIDNQKVIIEEDNETTHTKNIHQINRKSQNQSQTNDEDDLFGEIESVHSEKEDEKKDIKDIKEEELKLSHTTCKFLINPTKIPDIYELYCYSSNNNIEKYSLASVPDLETSKYLKSIINFDNLEENILTRLKKNKCIYVECNYNKLFKKWVPFKKTSSMDTLAIINKTQIILDSL